MGDDDAFVRRQGDGAFDRLKPLSQSLFTVNMMLTKEALKRAAPGELSRFEGRPLPHKVTKQQGILSGKPLQNLREMNAAN
jgi:hypothetical protein